MYISPLFPSIQWGTEAESTSATDYKYFPVTFNAEVYIAVPTSDYKSSAAWIDSINTEKFICGIGDDYAGNYNVSYFAIGR